MAISDAARTELNGALDSGGDSEARPDLRIYCKSSEDMSEVIDGGVSLTVTSPPYWNAIDYDKAAESDGRAYYRTRDYSKGFSGYEEYLDLMRRVFQETHRATKPGGFCAIVIGTLLYNGTHIPVPFHVSALMERIGWRFHQDIIWHKVTAGIRRAGVAIQKPYPGYYYPNIMTEYILIFRKDGPRIFENRNGGREESQYPIDELFKMDSANNVWHIAPVPPRTVNHPCPYPEEIPQRLITYYSYAGDTVLDPFLGSGQTSKVALASGRRAIGYEIERDFANLAEARSREGAKIRDYQLIARFDRRKYPNANQGALLNSEGE